MPPASPRAAVIIAAAGAGRRMGGAVKKQFRSLGGVPVLARSVNRFHNLEAVRQVVVVTAAEDQQLVSGSYVPVFNWSKVTVVTGGDTRPLSVRRGLAALAPGIELVLVHDAARPLVTGATISRVLDAAWRQGAAIPVLPLADTIKRAAPGGEELQVAETLDRSQLYRVQTPQGFKRQLLEGAYQKLEQVDRRQVVTDDASLVEALGHPVQMVAGDEANFKLTRPADFQRAERLLVTNGRIPDAARTGLGFDLHRFKVAGRGKLKLGGLELTMSPGLQGHSDADVVLHAVVDALLACCGQGDIGDHFPPGEDRWHGADSRQMLAQVLELLADHRMACTSVSVTLVAERPRLGPAKQAIADSLAGLLKLPASAVNVGATTAEGTGALGTADGMACLALAQCSTS